MYPTTITKNFMNAAQIDQFNSLCKSDEVWKATGGSYMRVGEEASKYIEPLLDLEPNEKITVSVLNSSHPLKIHVDIGNPNPGELGHVPAVFARTIIIPLEDYSANTIIFNDAVEHSSKLASYLEAVKLENKGDVSDIFYEQYLSHCPIEISKSLSVDTVFPWEAGSMISFYSGKLHCSDNYKKYGLSGKRGIIIFTRFPLE